jgi:predicted MFS family arabinose efflux permease
MSRAARSEMHAIRNGMRCSNVEAVFATIHLVLSQGIFLTNYVLDIGGSNLVCGIIQALPYTVQFTYFLSPMLVRRMHGRKPVAILFSILHRASWVGLILLLYVDFTPPIKQMLLVLILLGANACAVVAGNAWYSWMADLVPSSIRGSYYGRRNVYLGLTSMITLLVGSHVLTWFCDVDMWKAGYTICFSAAVLSAFYAAYILKRQYEPPLTPVPIMSMRNVLAELRKTPLLRDFIIFFTIWQFGMGVAAAFFGVHMVKVLSMSPAQMGYLSLGASAMALVGSRMWGRAMDRTGERAVVITSGLIISLQVWFWMLTAPGRLWPAWIVMLCAGFSWSGFNLAIFAWPQRMCSPDNRQYTYGMLGMISGPAFVIGSLTGGVLTTVLRQDLFMLMGFQITHFHLVFFLSSIMRGASVVLIAKWSLRYDRTARSIPRCINDTFSRMLK